MEEIKEYRKLILEHPIFVKDFKSNKMCEIVSTTLLLIILILDKITNLLENFEINNIPKFIMKIIKYC